MTDATIPSDRVTSRDAVVLPTLIALVTLLVLLSCQWLFTADLYFKDQPKTVSYTADIVLHGRLALPRDMLHQPATKPPLYNWIGSVAVIVTGSWHPFVLKLPSVLGAVGTAGVLAWLVRRFGGSWTLASLAAVLWLNNRTAVDLAFRARPDMLQAFFLTAAFAVACVLLLPNERPTRDRWWAFAFWASVSAAALTKGPMALLAIAFGLLLPLTLGRPGDVRRLRPLIGLPLCLLPVGAWLLAAWMTDADHVRRVLLGAELVDRIGTATPEGFAKPWWQGWTWFASKTLAWVPFTLAGAA
ncbi:MAG: phospholipid carrier-dependent glycosyltransferase, partial [Planctomycetota bacterium]